MSNVNCPYCNQQAHLVGGKKIYPHRPDLYEKVFYECEPCDAFVGCHIGTVNPLGRLANAELRKKKMAAHALFDPIWRTGQMTRGDAYKMLAEKLGIEQKDCHIGMFDVDMCNRVINVCREKVIGHSSK
jgi:hypothetical protein